ncbi:hypothetical protein MMC25_005474 [Agyrium rufum]|nr:hypothetical protein [Agyrium rufum]
MAATQQMDISIPVISQSDNIESTLHRTTSIESTLADTTMTMSENVIMQDNETHQASAEHPVNTASNVLAETSGNTLTQTTRTQSTPHESDDKIKTATIEDGVNEEGGDENDDEPNEEPHSQTTPMNLSTNEPKKKKRSKKKPKSKRGLNAPTGFEEFYVDAPLTPAEHSLERDLYDPNLPFKMRIETAIERYREKRRMVPEVKDLFDRYLKYGGIDAGPKPFGGGLDSDQLNYGTAREIAAFGKTTFIPAGNVDGDDPCYVVDFDGCLRAFLSSRLPQEVDTSTAENITTHTNLFHNFLNYLLHHDVCPEYTSQIEAARATCHLATTELWSTTQVQRLLPGSFATACSLLFGDPYTDAQRANTWANGPTGSSSASDLAHMSAEKALNTFKFALAAHGDEETFETYQAQTAAKETRCVGEEYAQMEIVGIEIPSEGDRAVYANLPGLSATGVVRARTWCRPGDVSRDLTVEEEQEPEEKVVREYVFWWEEEILEKCFVGMKFEGYVRGLSFGVSYLDQCLGVYVSFFGVLPNELMLGYRKHVYLPPRGKVNGGGGGAGYDDDDDDDGGGDENGRNDADNGDGEDGVGLPDPGVENKTGNEEDGKVSGDKAETGMPDGKREDGPANGGLKTEDVDLSGIEADMLGLDAGDHEDGEGMEELE